MNENFYHLATRVITGEAGNDEHRELIRMLAENPELRTEFDALKAAWESSAGLERPSYAAEDWQKVESRINKGGKQIFMGSSRWWSIAASVMLISTLALYFGMGSGMETLTADNGNVSFTLPDYSTVVLKKGSRLKYKKKFNENRSLELEGEALFRVTRNENSPFTVETGKTLTTVLGTEFVLRETGDGKVDLRVKEGKVSFGSKKGEKKIVQKGEAVTFENNTVRAIPTGSNNKLLWAENRLVFENTPALQVFEDVGHYFNINIENNADIRDCTFTGNFSDPAEGTIKDKLEQVLGVKIEMSRDKWTVSGGNCRQ